MCNQEKYINIQTGEELDLNKVKEFPDNAMLKVNPHLWVEWDFDKNNDLGLDVYRMTKSSNKSSWWVCCKCSSFFDSIIANRSKGVGCGYCRGLKVNHTNSLASLNPDLAKEWHPTLNGELTSNDVTVSSGKKVWWACSNNEEHTWESSVDNRRKGNNCPYCSGRFASTNNSIASIKPELISEWHPTKNRDKTPHNVSVSSEKKIWWLGKCNHEWLTPANSRCNGSNCPYCAGQKILVGFNDLWTTNPDIASILYNPDDGYNHSKGTHKKVDWKCPDCEYVIKNKSINKVCSNGLSCPKCSDGISYPEKFTYNFLYSLNIDFDFQKTFDWSESKRYDFYIPSLNMIIEVHGEQHYKLSFVNLSEKTLKQEQENDQLKEQLAKENGIKHYIIIDARESTMKWMKTNIKKSKLSELFNLDSIDWIDISKISMNSKLIEACSLFENDSLQPSKIAKLLKLSNTTILNYLKQGYALGINKHWNSNYKNKRSSRKVVQLTKEGELICFFESIKEALTTLGIEKGSMISQCCRGNSRLKSAYGFKWMYKEDYEKEYGKLS